MHTTNHPTLLLRVGRYMIRWTSVSLHYRQRRIHFRFPSIHTWQNQQRISMLGRASNASACLTSDTMNGSRMQQRMHNT